MKRAILLAALLWGLGWSVAMAQRPHPFDLLSSVAVDGTGRVVGNDPIDHGTLRVWEEGEWRPWNLRERWRSWSPVRVMSLANGNLASLWHRGSGEWRVAWSRGTEILGEVQFAWKASPTSELFITEAAGGALWLTTRSPVVMEVTPPKEEKPAAAREWDLGPWVVNPEARSWHTMRAVPDSRGGIWLWSYPSSTSQSTGRLPGLLHRSAGAETWQRGPELPEGAEGPIRFVGLGPEGVLWIGDYRGRLFCLTTEEDTMREFAPAPPRPLSGLARTWPTENEGVFVMAGTSTKPALWQADDDGWEQIVPRQKLTFADQFRTRQSLLRLPEGLLLGSREGVIWIPCEEQEDGAVAWGEARLLDWADGFPLVFVEQILLLPDGTIGMRAARGSARRWWVGSLEELLEGGSQAEQAEWIRPHRGWAVDAKDRVYTLLHERPTSLQEWSRGAWHDIPLPGGINTSRLSQIDVDAQARIVIVSFEANESVLLLEADRKTWQVFPDYFTALRELGNDAVDLWKGNRQWRPARTQNGIIAFLDRSNRLHLWNGEAWQRWDNKEFFTPERLTADPPNDPQRPWLEEPERRISAEQFGLPFVAQDGRMAINTLHSHHTWFWSGAGGWQAGPKESGPDDALLNPPPNLRLNQPPRGAEVPRRPRSVMEDNQGTMWIVAGGNLYRYRNGQTAPIFTDHEAHPFLSEPSLEEVRVDRNGFVWLRTGSLDHVLLHPPSAPGFAPRLVREKNGFVRLAEPPPLRLEWSTDGEHWHAARATRLGFIPPEFQEIFLRLIGEDLTVHPLPPQTLPAGGDPAAFWAEIVRLLREGEYEEKLLALAACERHPAAARVALQPALQQEANRDDWWLRVAWQATER
jgi:hypothetical protein